MALKAFGFRSDVESLFKKQVDDVISHRVLVQKIRRQLDAFIPRLEEAFTKFEFIDQDKARQCLAISRELLGKCEANPNAEFVPFCLAAINYFIETDDANPDFSTLDGFDDDLEVLEKVANFVRKAA